MQEPKQKKRSVHHPTESVGNQRNPKPNVSQGVALWCWNKYQRKMQLVKWENSDFELRDLGANFSFVIDFLCDFGQVSSHSGPVSSPVIWRKKDKMLSKRPSSISCDWGPKPPPAVPGHYLQLSLCACKAWEEVRGCLPAMLYFHLNSDLLSDLSTLFGKWQLMHNEFLRCLVQIWPGKSGERQSPDCSELTSLL